MTAVPIDKGDNQPAYLSLFWRYVAIAVLIWTVGDRRLAYLELPFTGQTARRAGA
jgi:hypothetical protein